MSTINGLPAHILLNHLVVVLGPLTAILAIVCALWTPARQRFVWLTLLLAVITLIATPITADAGAWLQARLGPSPMVEKHQELGETLTYFMAVQALAVALLVVMQVRRERGRAVNTATHLTITALVIVAAAATLVATYQVGDSGAQAAWGSIASALGPY
ncbi:hypothetical protein OSH39_01395 [Mycobacterium ulcerans]|uniref:DUF2231 domain-containing protein n=3 Tax=Mycobacterium ulcerans TaxID=1809 RepID=A0ABY3V612_MYCUL|nr:DUF2231 domain-containing protein [Mycobacterium ulcerans]EUA85645.1 putative membrane protein [Mycobacterium ulcerans str. Harvey]ABL06713.1 conserved hypothetical membrane protein [Mycobacterium ulcerans Agy99]MEB3903971.1 hypothetical protein [Mycobacterium ulcerans]MEB3908110.1 hypothetical protein [Mycobacterium ulcerans]MEB3918410.1 hypothetical protein [Mycobacterium ulcerans]